MKTPIKAWIAALSTVYLAACGGGGGGDTPATPVTPATTAYASGVMLKGSVIVNGVRYDDSAATVIDDRNRSVAQLADGMMVKLRGRINDDGRTGVAQVVKISNELRGQVTAVNPSANPPTITVRGVLVHTDETTVLANGLTITTALIGQIVEVHGLRDANGTLRATRIELQSGTGVVDEFKGAISSVSGTSFVVGGVTVTPAPNVTYFPAACSSAALRAGLVVEVHGNFSANNAFSATRIECEDLADDNGGVKPPAGARNKIEGFVSGLSSADNNVSGSFTIGSITVRFSATTQIRNGARADLANGVRVEVDGTLNGNELTAREISFKQERIILQGAISNIAGNDLTVLGQTVRRNDLTRVESGVSLTVGSRVEVRARFVKVNGVDVLIADEIREAGGGNREIVQARVTAKTADTITLLGVQYSFAPNAQFRDSRGATELNITRQQFFDAVTEGTLVKVRGEPFTGTSPRVATQGELES